MVIRSHIPLQNSVMRVMIFSLYVLGLSADSCFKMLITDSCVQTSLQSLWAEEITVIAGLCGFSFAWCFRFSELALQSPACWSSPCASLLGQASPENPFILYYMNWSNLFFCYIFPFLHSLTLALYLNVIVPPRSACVKIESLSNCSFFIHLHLNAHCSVLCFLSGFSL